MIFILGIIIGLLIALIIICLMTYFRRIIEHKTVIIEKMIENAGPKPKGYIIEPESDIEESRARIIAENKAAGKDTHFSDFL